MSDRIIIELGDNITALEVPEVEDDDVWKAIEDYDEAHGTDLWDRLSEADVLGVNLEEYDHVPAGDIGEVSHTGAHARRMVEDAIRLDQWDNDGQDDDRWYAVQTGISAEGWPITAHYSFPLDYEPETDEDVISHLAEVVELCPVSSGGPTEVSADLEVKSTANSLVLKITQQARMLGIDRGDIVNVTIRRKD